DKELSSHTPVKFINNSKDTLYQFSLYFSKIISQILSSSDKKGKNEEKNESMTPEKTLDNREDHVKNKKRNRNGYSGFSLNHDDHSINIGNIASSSSSLSSSSSSSSFSSSPSQRILPIYAIELFFKYFYDQILMEFHYMEQLIVSDKLTLDLGVTDTNSSTTTTEFNSSKVKYDDNANEAFPPPPDPDITFTLSNLSLKESYDTYCSFTNQNQSNLYHHEMICSNYEQYHQFFQEKSTEKNSGGIQYLYGQQLYHHDIHSQLYQALLKIEDFIFQISKSSCTLYLYTMTLLFRECQRYIHSYFSHIGIMNELKMEYEKESNTIWNEKDIFYHGEKEEEEDEWDFDEEDLSQEKNQKLDNISFNFLC
ncbi:hypothetical protein PIROE2DRAFT_18531, partial [Piromyces sp. E2]